MKRWYLSKTLWVNIIAAIAVFISAQFGYTVTAEETAVILAAINLVLRTITKEPLEW